MQRCTDAQKALFAAAREGDVDGETALHLATAAAFLCDSSEFMRVASCVRLLLEAGARTDLCEGDQQRTALQWAAEIGHSGLVSLLETHAITPLVRAADDAGWKSGGEG